MVSSAFCLAQGPACRSRDIWLMPVLAVGKSESDLDSHNAHFEHVLSDRIVAIDTEPPQLAQMTKQ